MFNSETIDALDREIVALVGKMTQEDKNSPDYQKMVASVSKLTELRIKMAQLQNDHDLKSTDLSIKQTIAQNEHVAKMRALDVQETANDFDVALKKEELKMKSSISTEQKVTIAANVLGIFAILGHERLHVVATKALGFVKKIA